MPEQKRINQSNVNTGFSEVQQKSTFHTCSERINTKALSTALCVKEHLQTIIKRKGLLRVIKRKSLLLDHFTPVTNYYKKHCVSFKREAQRPCTLHYAILRWDLHSHSRILNLIRTIIY